MHADRISDPELANAPRVSHSLSISRIWTECILLHTDSRHCVPRQHLWLTYDVLSGHISTRLGVDTLPYRC